LTENIPFKKREKKKRKVIEEEEESEEEEEPEPQQQLGTAEKAKLEFSLEDAMRILGIASRPSRAELEEV
jgi:hypothetical protein